MQDILFDTTEKPDWDRMVTVLEAFSEQEQQSIYNMIRGAQVLKRIEKESEDNHIA